MYTALYGKSTAELLNVTCHMGTHSQSYLPTNGNEPELSHTSQTLNLLTLEGWKAQ